MDRKPIEATLRTMLEGDEQQNWGDKQNPNCSNCGKEIQKGEKYKTISTSYHSKGRYCIACLKDSTLKNFLKNIPPRYHSASIKDFPQLSIDPNESYFIFGAVGTGKTHLGIAIGQNQAMENFCKPLFCNPEYLQRQIRASYSDNEEETEDKLLKPVQTADVLILDDLGSLQQMASKFSIDIIYAILDYRWNYALQTIITSNKTIEEIEKLYGPAIASRIGGITGMKFLEIKGKDRRCEG